MKHQSGDIAKGLKCQDLHFLELLARKREVGLDVLSQFLPFGIVTEREPSVNKDRDVGDAFLHLLIFVRVGLVKQLCQVIYHVCVDLHS
jgi:hypothetical protein